MITFLQQFCCPSKTCLEKQVFIENYYLFIDNKDIDQDSNIQPDVIKPPVSGLPPCVPVVSTPKLPTSTPIVIPSDGELVGSDGILSIKLNGITIYQSCVDGLLPQRMINDNIVSYLME